MAILGVAANHPQYQEVTEDTANYSLRTGKK